MDFPRILRAISDFFNTEGRPFALIDAFGLHTYGLSRATQDLDFAADAASQDGLVGFLESLGYKTIHRSSGYSCHLHEDASYGRIDFVYVAGETSRRLFAEANSGFEFEGFNIPVPRPEHLAAMKVHAIKNDPSRTHQDLADIQFLLGLPGVNQEEVRSYFEKGGLLRLYEQIRKDS